MGYSYKTPPRRSLKYTRPGTAALRAYRKVVRLHIYDGANLSRNLSGGRVWPVWSVEEGTCLAQGSLFRQCGNALIWEGRPRPAHVRREDKAASIVERSLD